VVSSHEIDGIGVARIPFNQTRDQLLEPVDTLHKWMQQQLKCHLCGYPRRFFHKGLTEAEWYGIGWAGENRDRPQDCPGALGDRSIEGQ
jgi:hypothetical protein